MIDTAAWGWEQLALLGWGLTRIVWAAEHGDAPALLYMANRRCSQAMRPLSIAAMDVALVWGFTALGGFFR